MTHTIAEFMETVASKNERTRAHYLEVLNALETWAGYPLGDLNENRLAALMKRLRGMKSGRHYAGLLRMFLSRFDMDALAKKARIAQRMKRLEPEEILTVKEVEAMINAAGAQRNRAFIAALYDTGVRVTELCSLTRADVAFKPANGGPEYYVLRFWNVKVRGEEHLGYMIRTAPVLKRWLEQHTDPRPEAPLFPSGNNGLHLTRKGGWAIVASAAKHAKIEKHVHPHTFRHSRATHLLQAGESPAKVCLLMGWVQGSTQLARYSHLTGEDAKDAAFRAAGYETPEAVPVDVLDFSDERLRPALPVPTFPSVPGQSVITFTEREQALMAMMMKRQEAALASMTPERLRYMADMMEAQAKGEPFPRGDRAMKTIPADTREGTIFADSSNAKTAKAKAKPSGK